MNLQSLMDTKVPVSSTTRGWEFIKFCRAGDLEESSTLLADMPGTDDLRRFMGDVQERCSRSKNPTTAGELPYISLELAYERVYAEDYSEILLAAQ